MTTKKVDVMFNVSIESDGTFDRPYKKAFWGIEARAKNRVVIKIEPDNHNQRKSNVYRVLRVELYDGGEYYYTTHMYLFKLDPLAMRLNRLIKYFYKKKQKTYIEQKNSERNSNKESFKRTLLSGIPEIAEEGLLGEDDESSS